MQRQTMESPDPTPTTFTSADEILEKHETAARLKISIRTLDEWMRSGRVPYIKLGKTVRFRWAAVLAHLQENTHMNAKS